MSKNVMVKIKQSFISNTKLQKRYGENIKIAKFAASP
jgi:hypothetical protein